MVGNSTAWHPRVGMTCTLKPASEEALAGIPARLVAVWPRFRSGDYLVTLEYARPVKLNYAFITHLDVFKSELECLAEGQDAAQRPLAGTAARSRRPVGTASVSPRP